LGGIDATDIFGRHACGFSHPDLAGIGGSAALGSGAMAGAPREPSAPTAKTGRRHERRLVRYEERVWRGDDGAIIATVPTAPPD
jgi:hypothetical protein